MSHFLQPEVAIGVAVVRRPLPCLLGDKRFFPLPRARYLRRALPPLSAATLPRPTSPNSSPFFLFLFLTLSLSLTRNVAEITDVVVIDCGCQF